MPSAERLLPYLQRIDEARWFTNFGPLAGELEGRLAERLGGAHVVAVSSGTQALALALRALAGGDGGYCAMPTWTFVATAHAAVLAGLKPWFVDVDPESWMLTPEVLRAALPHAPGKVAAVISVCAFGRTPELEPWQAFRAETGLPVLLDAAAAFDTLNEANPPAAVSLHATKILGAGEGGFVASADKGLVERIRQLSSFGFAGSRSARFEATNAKLSEYAAAVALASLDGWPATRLRYLLAAQRLRIALMGRPEVVFQPGWGSEWVSSTCVVGLPDDAAGPVGAALAEAGVQSRSWWGEGCHRHPAFAGAARTALPVTESLARRTLGLPFAIDITAEEIDRVAAALALGLDRG